jgi:hypothetical protein
LSTSAVAFISTGAKDRLPWLAAAPRAAANKRCHLYGNSWQGLATPGWHRHGVMHGVDYCKAMYHSRVVLGYFLSLPRPLLTAPMRQVPLVAVA